MAVKKGVVAAAAASAPQARAKSDEVTKEALQQRMDLARESISETVTEIKDTVVEQYESVKESVANTLDWREQFRSHPLAWSLGALSVGYVLGNSIAAAWKGDDHDDQLLSHLAALGDRFSDELSKHGMNILMPALTGTILVPMLTGKLNEMFGIDLSDLPNQVLAQEAPKSKASAKGKKKKKSNTKKNGKKKSREV
jgi:hypothetical protein